LVQALLLVLLKLILVRSIGWTVVDKLNAVERLLVVRLHHSSESGLCIVMYAPNDIISAACGLDQLYCHYDMDC